MAKKTIDDYIDQGIHGVKEINPEERKKFLGTLRERIVVALTAPQVRVQNVQPQFVEEMKNNTEAQLFLNGHIDYSHLTKYINIAKKYKVTYTIVNNQNHISDIGLVLAYDYAIDKEEIYLSEENSTVEISEKQSSKTGFSLFAKLFKK